MFVYTEEYNFENVAYFLSAGLFAEEFGISIFVTFSATFWLSHDEPFVSGGGNRSTWQKPPPNPKSLATCHSTCADQDLKQGSCERLRPHSCQGRPLFAEEKTHCFDVATHNVATEIRVSNHELLKWMSSPD